MKKQKSKKKVHKKLQKKTTFSLKTPKNSKMHLFSTKLINLEERFVSLETEIYEIKNIFFTLFCVFATAGVIKIEWAYGFYIFGLTYKILTSPLGFYFLLLLSLGTIIGWPLLFSIVKQPSSFKQELADAYIIFLILLFNQKIIPDKFISFFMVLGMFFAKKLITVFSIPFPDLILQYAIWPIVTFLIAYFLTIGYFIICQHYPKVFGKFLINFLEKNGTKSLLAIIGLASSTTKQTFKTIEQKNLNKRCYSTTGPSLAEEQLIEGFVEFKKSIATTNVEKNMLSELGKAIIKADGISTEEGYDIIQDFCEHPNRHNLYIRELSKSPETRNFVGDIFKDLNLQVKGRVKIHNSVSVESLAPTKETILKIHNLGPIKFPALPGSTSTDLDTNFLNNLGSSGQRAQAGPQLEYEIEVTGNVAPTRESIDNAWKALSNNAKKISIKGGVPASLAGAFSFLVYSANSETFPNSVNQGRQDFARIEDLNSFDSTSTDSNETKKK